jgi:hypothetical protein
MIMLQMTNKIDIIKDNGLNGYVKTGHVQAGGAAPAGQLTIPASCIISSGTPLEPLLPQTVLAILFPCSNPRAPDVSGV